MTNEMIFQVLFLAIFVSGASNAFRLQRWATIMCQQTGAAILFAYPRVGLTGRLGDASRAYMDHTVRFFPILVG